MKKILTLIACTMLFMAYATATSTNTASTKANDINLLILLKL